MVEYRLASGTPPQWQASPAPAIRCFIPPGWSLNDFSADQDVKLLFLEGIVVAEPARPSLST